MMNSRGRRDIATSDWRGVDLALQMDPTQNHQRPRGGGNGADAGKALLDLGASAAIGLRGVEGERARAQMRAIADVDIERVRRKRLQPCQRRDDHQLSVLDLEGRLSRHTHARPRA